MRRLWWLAVPLAGVAVAFLAGCQEPADEPVAADPMQHWVEMREETRDGFRSCGLCHYSPGPLAQMAWNRSQDGTWQLSVLPREPDVPLRDVQAVPAGQALTLSETGRIGGEPLVLGQPWSTDVVVPAGAAAIAAKAYAEPVFDPESRAIAPSMSATLVDPSGATHDLAPLGVGMLAGTVTAPAGGTWRLDVVLLEPANAAGYAEVDVLASMPVALAGPAAPARFDFPASAAPPAVDLRFGPFFDHDGYERVDWDAQDLFPYRVHATAVAGAPPAPRAWTPEEVAPWWEDAAEVLIDGREMTIAGAYQDQPGSSGDSALFGNHPQYGPGTDPVPPGTRIVRIEATWVTPNEQPDLGFRVKPSWTLRYEDAVIVSRSPGSAVFEVPVGPGRWSEPDADGQLRGVWDIAPYMAHPGGGLETDAFRGEYRAYAVRQ